MADGLAGRVKDRGPKSAGSGYWPDATLGQVERRFEVAVKAALWRLGRSWDVFWPRARDTLKRDWAADPEKAKTTAVVLACHLTGECDRAGVPLLGLLDDRGELTRFWRAMNGNRRRLRPPSDADLVLLRMGDFELPSASREQARNMRDGLKGTSLVEAMTRGIPEGV